MLTRRGLAAFAAMWLALVALGWVLYAGTTASREADQRSMLRSAGTVIEATVVEEGPTRPDGSFLGVHVNHGGRLVGVDLRDSDVRVHRLGDVVRVVVPPVGDGLPEDVVAASTTTLYLRALGLPLTALAGASVVAFVTTRRWLRPG